MSNKTTKQPSVPTVVTVEQAQATLAGFEKQREALIARHEQDAAARRDVAFAAHAGDPAASELLSSLHEEAVRYESRLTSITDACNEARRRLQQAHEAEAHERDRAQALQLREQLAAFVAAGKTLDGALEVLIIASQDMRKALTQMNRLGCSHPSHLQLDSLGALALRAALTQTGWSRYFEITAPRERKTFTGLVAAWSAQVERHIASRLDEQTDEPVEAA
jgi:hypothetical protein